MSHYQITPPHHDNLAVSHPIPNVRSDGRKWSLAPGHFDDISRLEVAVAAALKGLRSRQQPDGSWGSDHPLDKVVSTCQCLMVLMSFGTPTSDTQVVRALEFLSSPYVGAFQWGFWRIAPMIGMPAFRQLVENDLREVERRVEARSGPSPDQLLTAFLASSYLRMRDEEKARPHIVNLLAAYDEKNAWAGRGDATSHALSVILNSNQSMNLGLKRYERSVEVLLLQSERRDIGQISWGNRVTSTAYVAMNIIDCAKMKGDDRLHALLPQIQQYLVSSQREDGLWEVEPTPYGGDLEIVARDYYSAVALRGLIAVSSSLDCRFLEKLWYAIERETRHEADTAIALAAQLKMDAIALEAQKNRTSWRAQAIIVFLLGLIILPQLLMRLPSVAKALDLVDAPNSDILLSRYASWASLAAIFVSCLTGLASLMRLAKRRLGKTSTPDRNSTT